MSVKVYSKYNCPHCVRAKALLKNMNINYHEINIEEDISAKDFLVSQGLRTLPQIYSGNTLIGGADQLTSTTLSALR